MPLGTLREKVLFGLGRKRGRLHRYALVRWVVGIGFTVGVALLPLAGVLRFDFWGGHHVVLGREVDLVEAAKAFAFPFLAVNVLIVLASRFVGRYLCGFVCPYGAMARFAEWFRAYERSRGHRLVAWGGLFLVCLALSAVAFSFWVDWRVFSEGSGRAVAVCASLLLGAAFALFFAVMRLGLRFCRDWCPSGVYFALLGHDSLNGVAFAHPESCTDCGACTKVCPMDLEPRHLVDGAPRATSGFYPEGTTNLAQCIRCGDCVIACEGVRRDAVEPVSLALGWLEQPSAEAEERAV